MTTRAVVTIINEKYETPENKNLYLYIHCDGYPEAVTPLLNEFLQLKGAKTRLMMQDTAYLMAWLVSYTINEKIKEKISFNKKLIEAGEPALYNIDEQDPYASMNDFTGVGIEECIPGDVSYLYSINMKGEITTYQL